MISFPNCKINIGLFVTGRRADGYHDLETVFYPLSLRDALEIIPSPSGMISFHPEGLPVQGSISGNLVMKAYRLLQLRYPERVKPLEIWLYKNIPMGAGLGGGSADGAFMLRLLNDYFDLRLDQPELVALALQLGSDCPFFIYNTPQFATGRGEHMTPVSLDLSGYRVRLVCPDVHVSTAAAFRMIEPRQAGVDLSKLGQLPVAEWKEVIVNDFEAPVFGVHPILREIKDQLYAQGAVYASMSGSGSALYGIFPEGKELQPLSVSVPFAEYTLTGN